MELKEIDARYLPSVIDKESCDVTIPISVLEHIPEYKITIEEIKTCLKPKGILVRVVPTENLPYKIRRRILRYHNENHKGYNFKELRAFLSKNFHEVKTWFSPFIFHCSFQEYIKNPRISYIWGSVYERPLNSS